MQYENFYKSIHTLQPIYLTAAIKSSQRNYNDLLRAFHVCYITASNCGLIFRFIMKKEITSRR